MTASTAKEDSGMLAALLGMQRDVAMLTATIPHIQSDIGEIKVSVSKELSDLEKRVRDNEEYRLRMEGSLTVIKVLAGGGSISGIGAIIIVLLRMGGALP